MRDERSPAEVVLDWIGNRLDKIRERTRHLNRMEKGIPELGIPPQSAELKDLGIIRAWLKSCEAEIFDELEGVE
tara:strand:- start:380 stop:601 length:222 start_codon:yes stop_codon:yes gene_type:complete